MSEEKTTPLKIPAYGVKKGQVIMTDFGRSYVTGVNAAESESGKVSFVIFTFIVNDQTEKQSYKPNDKLELLKDVE